MYILAYCITSSHLSQNQLKQLTRLCLQAWIWYTFVAMPQENTCSGKDTACFTKET